MKERQLSLEEKRRVMKSSATEAARYLKEQYHVQEVYLFGSLAQDKIHRGSDIDLLVVGAPPDPERMAMASETERLLSPFEGHVIFADEVSDGVRRSAIKRGIRLA